MSFNIHIDTKGFEGLREALGKSLQRATSRSTSHVTQVAIHYAPRKTGNLKRSIHSEPVTSPGGTFLGSVVQDQTVASYGKFIEHGTGLYGPNHSPIVPKTKAFLVWRNNGRWYRKKSVKGIKPRRFMWLALAESVQVVKGIYKEEIDKGIKEATRYLR